MSFLRHSCKTTQAQKDPELAKEVKHYVKLIDHPLDWEEVAQIQDSGSPGWESAEEGERLVRYYPKTRKSKSK